MQVRYLKLRDVKRCKNLNLIFRERFMEIKKIALIGAGAVGAYFIYGMSELEDIDFCVVAEGLRADRLKENGIIINDKLYRPVVCTPAEAKGADLILVCTKYQALEGVLDMLDVMVEENTVVMSLLNGIDSEDIIAERIGQEHLVYSVTRISSERRDKRVHFVPETTIGISFGEKDSAKPSERVLAIAKLFEMANLKYKIEEDILLDQWSKYSMNIIYNIPQAILDVGFGAYYDSENVGAIRDRMFEEVCKVAHAEGITLKNQGDWRSACVKKARFSTLQDIDAKRHTEIDMFTGSLIKLAHKHGIDVPFCEFAHLAVKALEEKGEGKFDYI